MTIDAASIAKALGGKVRGGRVYAPGPGHSNKDKSLVVFLDPAAPEGFRVHSFADDWRVCAEYVREKIGLPSWNGHADTVDLSGWYAKVYPKKEQQEYKGPTREVTAYDYIDDDGEVLYQVVRFEPKDFRQRRPNGAGGWVNNLDGVRRILYRLPDLIAHADPTVFFTEGEKDADRLAALGHCATTVAGSVWGDVDPAPLAGRDVLILEDNDAKGRERAREAAERIAPVAKAVRVVRLPGLPDKGDVSDFLDVDPGHADDLIYLCFAAPIWGSSKSRGIKTVDFFTLMTEDVIEEPDYIEPDFAGPGGFVLVAGPPKAQKSFLLQEMLVAAATGAPFLAEQFRVPRPLRVFYLQAEMNRKLLRKRARMIKDISPARQELLRRNLISSERFYMILNADGVQTAIATIKAAFPHEPPDIIAIDPMANVFDQENESDNAQVMKFLTGRVEVVRQAVNPLACIVMVHHSTKKSAEDLARDPFPAIRGASALRGYYDSAIVIFRKDEESKLRKVHFELRSGESPEPMTVNLVDGRFYKADEMDAITPDISRMMLQVIDSRWKEGMPLGNHWHNKDEGRYAPQELSKQFKVPQDAIKTILAQWFSARIIAIEVYNTSKKSKGIKVIGRL